MAEISNVPATYVDLRATLKALPVVTPKGATAIECSFYYSGTKIPMDIWGLDTLPRLVVYNRGLLEDIVAAGAFSDTLPTASWKATAHAVEGKEGYWGSNIVLDVPVNTIMTAFWFFKDNLTSNTITYEQHYRAGAIGDSNVNGGNAGLVQDAHNSDDGLWSSVISLLNGSGSLYSLPGRVISLMGGAFSILRMVGGNSLFLSDAKTSSLEASSTNGKQNQVQIERVQADNATLGGTTGRIEDSNIDKVKIREDSSLEATNLKVGDLTCNKSSMKLDTTKIDNLGQVQGSQLDVTDGTIDGQPSILDSSVNLRNTDMKGNMQLQNSHAEVTGGSQTGKLIVTNSYYESTGTTYGA